jgi:cytochrome c2
MRSIVFLLVATAFGTQAAEWIADSSRGQQLFTTLSCVECHSLNGKGASIGPDLGRIADRGFTPAMLAATMWNHAPAMWAAMQQREIRAGDLNERAAADLFAYFYSVRFFELPGDAARGKRTFVARRCANCHADAALISQWTSLSDASVLIEAMWNHAPPKPWSPLAARDLTDILVYLRNPPFPRTKTPAFQISAGLEGEAVFRAKGCANCHPSVKDLARGKTLTELAAAMWNHAPMLSKASVTPPKFAAAEMNELLSYLWAREFFEDSGSAAAGRKIFASKKCASCHDSGTAPKLERRVSGSSMVSALWRHGPSMLAQMKTQHVPWPRFEGSQMADLIAYLNAKK